MATDIDTLLREQAGVVSRRQALEHGLDDNDIERKLRRREWATVHPGVYVDHTGPPSWLQRAWAAVLAYWPAALYGRSALKAADARAGRTGSTDEEPIQVAIEHPRKAANREGVRVHRVVGLTDKVQWNLGPPRMRFEEAVVSSCSDQADADRALAVAADACQERRTTPERLLRTLEGRRVRHGAWLRRVLEDVASGALSLLEHGYLHRVERPHGLPAARRQRPVSRADGADYQDALYEEARVVVELDGRLAHEWTEDRWADMDRDLDAGADGELTIRLGWRHVFGSTCRTAERVARILQGRGWSGTPRACGPTCVIASLPGRFPAPGADDQPA